MMQLLTALHSATFCYIRVVLWPDHLSALEFRVHIFEWWICKMFYCHEIWIINSRKCTKAFICELYLYDTLEYP